MAELPIAPVKRLAKSKDRDIRIGDTAAAVLIEKTEKFIELVSTEASSLARYAGRKTINETDIRTAVSKLGLNLSQ